MSPRSDKTVQAMRALVLAVLYWALGQAGLGLSHFHDNVTLFWAPTGLALAALIAYGRGLWPGVLLGVLTLSISRGTDPLMALGFAVGNTLEVWVGVWALDRLAGFRPTFERVEDVVAFVLIGVVGATAISAVFGVATIVGLGDTPASDAGLVGLIWWLGDLGGAVVVAPALLLARFGSPTWASLARSKEAWILLGLLLLSAWLPFGGDLPHDWALLAVFLPFPLVVWAGGRLGTRGAAVASSTVVLCAIAGTAANRGPFVLEATHTSMMLLWSYGTVVGVAGLTLASAIAQRDLAELQQHEGERERLQIERRMHQAQRLESLGLLAGGIAHDFNNILTITLGNATMLRDDVSGDETAMERLDRIETATQRAAELCQRLLAYAGRGPARRSAVDLAALVEETCALVRTSLPQGIGLVLPECAKGPVVEGDETLLRQVVMNLVLNAADAITGDGTIRIETRTTELDASALARLAGSGSAQPGRFACIEVIDSGEGMDAETMERIFDPFFTTKPDGRGLGLASVIGIVQGHGGVIDVESDVDRGTHFRIHLPAGESRAQAAALRPGRGEKATKNALILLADDEPGIRELVGRILEKQGHRTLRVADGREALEVFEQRGNEIDAMLVDITMPRLSGLDVLREVRRHDAAIPVLLMSGYDAPDGDWANSPTRFLQKPFGSQELLAALDDVFDHATEARS